MSKILDNAKAVGILFNLISNLVINVSKLNEDFDNNYKICRDISSRVIEQAGLDFSVYGQENIPNEGSVLIASNHRNFFDIIVLLASIERAMSFVVAQELYSYPFLKDYIESINCVSVDRNTTDSTLLKKQLTDMKNGLNSGGLILFPEGQCNYEEDYVREFKKGGFVAARSCNSTIVPTYINVENVTRLGRWVVPRDKVTVTFGKSFTLADIPGKKPNSERLAEFTRDKVLELKGLNR